jgi:hypothetical protein
MPLESEISGWGNFCFVLFCIKSLKTINNHNFLYKMVSLQKALQQRGCCVWLKSDRTLEARDEVESSRREGLKPVVCTLQHVRGCTARKQRFEF